jgi:uncharacterized protein
MEYRKLGNSGLEVSTICFGSLTVGPLQANLPLEEGARIIAYGFDKGINFIDTAELYQNYDYIKKALELRKSNKEIIIASKCYAYDRHTAKQSLDKALDEMGLGKISIFMLHEQESELTLKGHWEAIEYFKEQRDRGIIGAIGISTHHVQGVLAACKHEEIEIIHPILNIEGLGIADGSLEDMLKAIEYAHSLGKGIYSMKPLGGGNLIHRYDESIDFVLKIPHVQSVAIGMQSIDEIECNTALFQGLQADPQIKNRLGKVNRRLAIASWCQGCGKCTQKCSHGAMTMENGKAQVDPKTCVLCGYCSRFCPDFCIKII